MKINRISLFLSFLALALGSFAQNNTAEEVAWVIGDTPIWKSEIEEQIQTLRSMRSDFYGDPYCVVPEQIAVQKLFLHQADLDTIEVQESMVISRAESQINFLITQLGSKEKVEQYFNKSIPELRRNYMDMVRNDNRVQMVQQSLTKDIKSTPADVRRYFNSLPADSLPFVPRQVEVEIITFNPVVPRQDVEEVKSRLREYAEAVNSGKSNFSTLAILYSEDAATANKGGETGFMSKSNLDPEFAAVAFNLNDPSKVSRIVESEFGYHIIQLIEKRGDRINCRHILLTPKVPDSELDNALSQLDTLRQEIEKGTLTFEEAVIYSQDKDTRANKGKMVNENTRTTFFEMSQLPQEVAKQVATLEPGQISKPFVMRKERGTTDIVAMVKLVQRVEGHQADMRNDYQLIKNMYENAQREKILSTWIEKKIAETYVRIENGWRNCDFQYKGWIKERSATDEEREATRSIDY